jgi:hypothetical protein
MIDTCPQYLTVEGMNLLLILVLASVLVAGAVLLLRRSILRRVRDSISAQTPENLSGGRADSGKVAQVAQAYSRGEIDESTIKAAAKVLGISAAEATRRLDTAAQQPDAGPETQRARSVAKSKQVAARRKKNKHAKQSRRGNRH